MKRTTFNLVVFSGFLTLLIITLFFRMTPVTKVEGRWYTQETVDNGAILFQLHCASCHGANAEGTHEWKKTDSLGNYPPPPLNGTAHTWHHDFDVLKNTIRNGGVRLGGTMPSFKDKVSDREIESLIAFIQSKWPYDIYQLWRERFMGDSVPSIGYRKKDTGHSTLKTKSIHSQSLHPDFQISKSLFQAGITNTMSERYVGIVE